MECYAPARDSFQEGAQITEDPGIIFQREAQLTQHELAVALATRRIGQALAQVGQVGEGDVFTRG